MSRISLVLSFISISVVLMMYDTLNFNDLVGKMNENDDIVNPRRGIQLRIEIVERAFELLRTDDSLNESLKDKLHQLVQNCMMHINEIQETLYECQTETTKQAGENKNVDHSDLFNKIKSTILQIKPDVKFSDIIGLDTAIKALQRAVIIPMLHPDIFSEKLHQYSSILLFGVSKHLFINYFINLILFFIAPRYRQDLSCSSSCRRIKFYFLLSFCC